MTAIAAKVLNERIQYLSTQILGRLKDLEANERSSNSIRTVLNEHVRERDDLVAAVLRLDGSQSEIETHSRAGAALEGADS